MADGQSTGPASTPPVSPAESVVQPGSFASELDDDQVNLHLMNNHVIQDLVERYNDAMKPKVEIMENQYALPDHVRVGGAMNFNPPDTSEAAVSGRREANQNATAQLSDQLETEMQAELQRVNDAVDELARILNGSNSTAQNIRQIITQIDARVAPLVAQLEAISPIILQARETYRTSGPHATVEYLTSSLHSLDAAGISPPSISMPTYVDPTNSIDVGSWAYYIRSTPNTALSALEDKVRDLNNEIANLTNQYPEVYKNYNRLLGGNSLAQREIDWWKIASTVGWIIAEEAAWTAAAIVLAPLTAGVGTAVIASARIARRAGAIGRLVAGGIGAGVNIARWYARLEDRVQGWAFDVFKNAWRKVRGRPVVRPVRPGSQVDGNGQRPNDPGCPIGACALN